MLSHRPGMMVWTAPTASSVPDLVVVDSNQAKGAVHDED
jgi:hypothetical protein